MPSPFRKPIILMPLAVALGEDGWLWEKNDEKSWILLTEGFGFDVGHLGSEDTINVPFQFVTDLASIPKPFLMFISPHGLHAGAAILHDFLYRSPDQRWRGRSQADRIFHQAMIVSDVPFWRAHIVFLSVRIGGWATWLKNGKEAPALTLSDIHLLRKKRPNGE